jgi:hypothetical protein
MAYYKTEQKDNGYQVVMRDYEGNTKTLGKYTEAKQARDVESLLSMVESVWCYNGSLKNNRYIEERCIDRAFPYDKMRELATKHWAYLNDNYYTSYAGMDSEGVSYNTIKHK